MEQTNWGSLKRFSRQILFSPIGVKGQKRLRNKHVLIIGAGALGSGNAEMLVRSGAGKVTIADRDYVEESNLQRQQLYTESDAAQSLPKAVAAEKRLKQINSSTEISGVVADVTPEVLERFSDVDLIIDATDNFDIRFLINDFCQKQNIPWIYGACLGAYGISCNIIPGKTPCLACLLDQIPLTGATCDSEGIIAPVVQMVTAVQTAEALKILTENRAAIRNTLICFDLWNNEHSEIAIEPLKQDSCLSCGRKRAYPHLDFQLQTKAAVLCGRDTVQIRSGVHQTMNLEQWESHFQGLGFTTKRNPYLLSVQLEEPYRIVCFQDGRVLVHGTNRIETAKNVYYRYFGA
ncbi:adenylyltransferase/sulfurtransferase [Melghiribacillus thermohalophilus]|uniref:Adenylyltransferase/sulfurtransferase n=1 Tax=Melghiribacillus thermohalophilus TaxID=1324956 RepID=A0A4R3MZ47_9BACI|nr:MoeB/ThiF family adenylyltransferase [Melghiribacillus thermohalophilus]TCT20023.1 adenylyltransferase/sulfurtransferase [Melghiribacillus thermohalophilus]